LLNNLLTLSGLVKYFTSLIETEKLCNESVVAICLGKLCVWRRTRAE